MSDDVDGCEFVVGDLDASRVPCRIELAMDRQACFRRRRCGDELNDHLMAYERLAAPVAGDEREHPMLDLVPLVCPWRQVATRDGEAEFVGQFLQLGFPQAHARTVAAATIGGDQQAVGIRIPLTAHRLPPASDGVDREGGRVVRPCERSAAIDADAHPSGVVADIVDAIRSGATEFWNDEVVHAHRLG